MTLQSDALRRTALILVSVGLVWNLVEAGVALWAGASVGSVALLAFGLDSVVELFAGGVLVWQFRRERDGLEDEAAETRAQRLIGLTFFLLAAYVGIHSGASLLGWLPEPQPSLVGVVIAVASAVVMSILYVFKMRIATRMQSRSLRAEAVESLFCDLQDLVILVGLGFNALFSWWWADPVAALLLIPLFIKEGRENIEDEDDDDEDEDEVRQVCFCPSCVFGLFTCRAACCRAG
ncbi:MAG: cation transporter [Dehalococcoidia bacterium]|nr:cation transporter [Dehalococcoidia bacterium]